MPASSLAPELATTARRRVLVTYGSRRGGTQGLAEAVARALEERGHAVDVAPAAEVADVAPYDAVIIGGGLYVLRWVAEARRFVARHRRALRTRPVWMFSSGPLDDSASARELPPPPSVAALMARVGARGHVTFGGRLAADARGFPASAMAKTHAGDWRDWAQVARWADEVAAQIAAAGPALHAPVAPPRRWLLAALCLLVGVTAVAGGATLVARPDGALMELPLAVLAHAPFANFLIPGLVLLFVVGGSSLLAGIQVMRDANRADALAMLAGVVLLGWIGVQMILLRTIEGLQVGYLLAAIAIVAEARRRSAR